MENSPTAKRLAGRIGLVLGLALLVLPVCYSLLTPYMAEGQDTAEYLVRQIEFHENIVQGNLFPQWAGDLVRGNGEPLFIYNPPMIYYLVEFWHLLGFNFVLSISLACVAIVIASAVGMFLLGRLYFGDWGGWLAAAAYIYAPYFAVNLYVRGALAEFAAFPFFAFALYGFAVYSRSGKPSHWILGALAFAGIPLSHNAAALFFAPLLLAFFVFTSLIEPHRQRSWKTLSYELLGLAAGLGVSACVWIPSLAEGGYVRLFTLLEGWQRYYLHFVHPRQLIYSAWGYGYAGSPNQSQASFSLGWSHLVLVAVVLAVAIWRPKLVDWKWLVFFATATLVYCLMMTPVTQWIWDRVRLLQYVVFPWRMLGLTSVCIALLVAPLGPILRTTPRYRKLLFGLAMSLLIAPNLLHNRPKNYRVNDPSLLTPARLAQSGVEPSTLFEYGPRWIKAWPDHNTKALQVIEGDAEAENLVRTETSWSAEIRAPRPTRVQLSVTWFPGWMVDVDNQPVRTWPGEPTGAIQFDLPSGTHQVKAFFRATPVRAFAHALSLISLIIVALVGGWNFRRRLRVQTKKAGA